MGPPTGRPVVMDRALRTDMLLDASGWAGAERLHLVADASVRRYVRLHDPQSGRTALLMDAPPESAEDVASFIRMSAHLRGMGLSAPEILAEDRAGGLLLIEDFGDDLYARVLDRRPDMELPLYEAATDVLVALHDAPLPDLTAFGPRELAELAMVSVSEYGSRVSGTVDPAKTELLRNLLEDVMFRSLSGPCILAHRDYHAENLIWLPGRSGLRRVGLLDFQDAILAHPAFDIVLLLQDVRRPPSSATAAAMLKRYIARSGLDDNAFQTAYSVLSAQRALRILGVFARLIARDGKQRYLPLMAPTWANLTRSLEDPALAPVADVIADLLPPPSPGILGRLTS